MLPTTPGGRSIQAFLVVLLPGALGACNLVFDIRPGIEGEPSTGGSTTSGTGATTSMGGGGTGGTATGGGGCAPSGGPMATGKSYARRFSNAPGHDTGRALAFDAEGNLIVGGTLTAAGFDLGGGELPYTGSMDYPNETVYVAKLGPGGEHLASGSWSATGTARLHAVAVDRFSGDVVIAGDFNGTIDVGGTMLTSFDPMYEDIFVARLGPDLQPKWAKKFGQDYRQHPFEIAVDSQGAIVIAGGTFDEVDLGDGPIGGDVRWSSFVVKLDPDGGFVWNQFFDHLLFEEFDYDNHAGVALALLPDDDVLVGGSFKGPVFFGGAQTLPEGGADAYLVRLSGADSSLVWKRFYTGGGGADTDGDQWVTSLARDACGDIYVAGAFTQGIEAGETVVAAKGADPAMPDMFLFKVSPSGDPIWQKTYGDVGWQEPTAVRADAFGHVALAGFFKDAPGFQGVDFGSGISLLPNVPDPGPNYLWDGFVVKLSPDGTALWGHRLGDESEQRVYDAAFDEKGQLAVTGTFYGSMVLDGAQTPIMADGFDMYIGWYDEAQ